MSLSRKDYDSSESEQRVLLQSAWEDAMRLVGDVLVQRFRQSEPGSQVLSAIPIATRVQLTIPTPSRTTTTRFPKIPL
jgi:hypothetical protein